MDGVNKIRGNSSRICPAAAGGVTVQALFGAFRSGNRPFFLFEVRDTNKFFHGYLGPVGLVVAMRGTSAGQGQCQQWQADRLSIIQIFSGNLK